LVQQNIAQAEAQVKQLEGQVEQERGSLEQAQINLEYTRVVAPQDGWVTKRNVEVGDYPQSGQQIMALVVPEFWVTANFKETALTRMRPG
jgi:membrane fusion protein (multidrug efflux system)